MYKKYQEKGGVEEQLVIMETISRVLNKEQPGFQVHCVVSSIINVCKKLF